jgi:ABC-type Zn uptake system ZnuABC Zn-binding protein ZnuA
VRLPVWQAGTVLLVAAEGSFGLWLSVKLNAPSGATLAVLSGGVFACAALARAVRAGRLAAIAVLVIAAPALAACAGSTGSTGPELDAVATTTLAADWVREVGGRRADVHGILRPNTDPHEYEPRPADVEAVAGADVVFKSGGGLDDWVDELVDRAGGDTTVVDLGARLPGLLEDDPHWWQDPRNVERATARIAAALSLADGAGAAAFERNAARYRSRLRRLDRALGRCMRSVPAAERKLVTDHDAFAYFAHRYGIEVVGAVIPARASQAQASARDVSDLVEVIEREQVRAIFPEHALGDKLVRSIARETGADASLSLYSDALGPDGSGADTFASMLAANADAMVRGFTGGERRCRPALD